MTVFSLVLGTVILASRLFILFTRIKPFHSYLYMEGSICDCASLGFVGAGGFTIASV